MTPVLDIDFYEQITAPRPLATGIYEGKLVSVVDEWTDLRGNMLMTIIVNGVRKSVFASQVTVCNG